MCHAIVRQDEWIQYCKKKHVYKFKNNSEIKYKIIEVKFSDSQRWKPYTSKTNVASKDDVLEHSFR